jgi:hypothetical protein
MLASRAQFTPLRSSMAVGESCPMRRLLQGTATSQGPWLGRYWRFATLPAPCHSRAICVPLRAVRVPVGRVT